MISTMSAILRKILRICVPIAVYVLIWQLLSMLVGSSLLLPSPKDVFLALLRIFGSGDGWRSIGTTVARIVCGYLCGCAVGVLLALLTAHSKTIAWLLHPMRTLVKTTPITSFALILLISIASGLVPVAVAAIVVVPMIWRTTEESILRLDAQLKEMSKIYFTPIRQFRYVTLPQILPQFFATASTAFGFAWKAVVTAEILSLPRFGIGNQMYLDKLYLDYPDLFAWTLLVILFSVILENAFRLILKKAGYSHD